MLAIVVIPFLALAFIDALHQYDIDGMKTYHKIERVLESCL